MAPNDAATRTKDKKDKKSRTPEEKAAARAQKREGRTERKSQRKEKSTEKGKPARLCSLATVEVKKGSDGYHVAVKGQKSFTIASNEASQVLRDLETAIQVIRGQV